MLSNFGRKFAPDSIQSGEWDGWDDLTRLTAQVETLAREPAGAPAPNIHIPLK